MQDVARGIGLDGRIGRKFLHAGPGFGGSCFPKDCLALVRTAQEAGAPLGIVETVVDGNDARKARDGRAHRSAPAAAASRARRSPCLGLTFKPNTDDMRESPSLAIVPALQAAGATVRAFDPEGMDEAKKLLPGIVFCASAYEAMEGAHALVIVTEWNEFRALDLGRVQGAAARRRSSSICATSTSPPTWPRRASIISASAALRPSRRGRRSASRKGDEDP